MTPKNRWMPLWGALSAVALLMWAELPIYVTSQSLRTVYEDETKLATEVQRMRDWGNEKHLRQLAYGNIQANPSTLNRLLVGGIIGFVPRWLEKVKERSGEFYFRVYGRLFTDLPPQFRSSSPFKSIHDPDTSGEDGIDAFEWDEDRGGDRVGARLRGLNLVNSRMDWQLESVSALAYGEWTLEFHNRHRQPQEARCQLLLPPGATISRLTLWVNGEPREAAFAAKAKVKEAYQEVAVRQQLDPVLVNMVGPDRAMTQCFPVPAGGNMKIRLGMTAPLTGQGLHLPRLIERNFTLSSGLRHSLWVQGEGAFQASQAPTPTAEGARFSWQQEVTDADLAKLRFTLSNLGSGPSLIWTEDPHAVGPKKIVQARRQDIWRNKPEALIVVVDGSLPLQSWAEAVNRALLKLAEKGPVEVILATDEGFQEMTLAQVGTLKKTSFLGGRDNVPALMRACERAREMEGLVEIVWLHGPQPFDFANMAGIQQSLERAERRPVIHALALEQGPNRLLENLYRFAEFRIQGRCVDEAALLQALDTTVGAAVRSGWVFSWHEAAPTEPNAVKVWDHLARQAVAQQVLADYQAQGDSQTLANLAARHQLVTAVSGAVVLETQAQYSQTGLQPVDANSTPQLPKSVPEPGRVVLLLLGLAIMTLHRQRRVENK